MSSIFTNVLSNEELEYLNNHPEVILAKSTLDSQLSGKVYFSVNITESIRNTLQTALGLSFPLDRKIPMRLIKGDTVPHVDTGASYFKNTYLVYLNDSPGELIVDFKSYPIQSNTGFVFNEGLSHQTLNTQNVPRLMIGPMNEFAEPVGEAVINNVLCFHENTKILTDQGYIVIKDLKKGALVKTLLSGFVPIEAIGHSKIYNPANKQHSKNRLYKCSKEQYPELEEDLILTGCHSILLDRLTDDQRKKSKEYTGDVYVTETKLRLIACLDERSEPYDVEGIHNIWHFCLENEDKYMNYGCYANGLLVETTSIRMMHELSGMELV
jgi:hypothetical protein